MAIQHDWRPYQALHDALLQSEEAPTEDHQDTRLAPSPHQKGGRRFTTLATVKEGASKSIIGLENVTQVITMSVASSMAHSHDRHLQDRLLPRAP